MRSERRQRRSMGMRYVKYASDDTTLEAFCTNSSLHSSARHSIVVVELESSDCPNVTLVDLPGLVRTHVTGQSSSIVDDVENLVDYYISNPSSIILSLIPSNVDFATSSAMAKAVVVDPGGDRTIGVLTKCDLVEQEEWGVVRGK